MVAAVVLTAEALVASPASAAKVVDEQQLPVPVASEAVDADAEAEADQVAKLRKQIEEKKALLSAKAKVEVCEAEQGNTATAKAADDAADDPTIV